ncbi:hypothetical protein BGZ94_006229, partial [Podila epigama]
MSPAEAQAFRALQSQDLLLGSKIISTDGSMLQAGTAKVSMAFAVVDQSSGTVLDLLGKTDGHASSTKAELMGLLAAIASTPSDQNILLQLDNKAVVDQFETLVVLRSFLPVRHQQRALYAGLWAVIAELVQKRAGSVQAEWVRGHANNQGNIIADKIAGAAARSKSTPWSVNVAAQS